MKPSNAISRLQSAGVTRQQIKSRLRLKSASAVSHWATGRSVPRGENLRELVKLGAEYGVILLANDFASGVSIDRADGGEVAVSPTRVSGS